MSFKVSSIFEYTVWLLKKYNNLQNQGNNIYRLINIKQLHSGQYKLIVQIIGKSSIIECFPQEIIADDRLLEGFSKTDIRTITYFACNPINKPKYKIITQEFSEKNNRMTFKLKKNQDKSLLIKTASQIIMDKDILDNLSKEDINSISYIAGYECSQNERFIPENNHVDNKKSNY